MCSGEALPNEIFILRKTKTGVDLFIQAAETIK